MKKSKLFAVFATVIIGGSIVGVLICANPENDENTLIQQQLVPMSCSATIIRIYFQIRTHSQKR